MSLTKIPADMVQQKITINAMQATTSGTSINFSNVPSWATRVTIALKGVSTNGTSNPLIQLGDSGGIEATGYNASASTLTNAASSQQTSTGFGLTGAGVVAGSLISGVIVLQLLDAATNLWACSFSLALTNAAGTLTGGGDKALSAALDRIRLTTAGGTDTFDAGAINILYEG